MPKTIRVRRKAIGQVGVDSGTLFIADPCVFEKWQKGFGSVNSSFDKCAQVGEGVVHLADPRYEGVITGTYQGDGLYTVFQTVDIATTRPIGITIDFLGILQDGEEFDVLIDA